MGKDGKGDKETPSKGEPAKKSTTNEEEELQAFTKNAEFRERMFRRELSATMKNLHSFLIGENKHKLPLLRLKQEDLARSADQMKLAAADLESIKGGDIMGEALPEMKPRRWPSPRTHPVQRPSRSSENVLQ